jgi:hypothetical protein
MQIDNSAQKLKFSGDDGADDIIVEIDSRI